MPVNGEAFDHPMPHAGAAPNGNTNGDTTPPAMSMNGNGNGHSNGHSNGHDHPYARLGNGSNGHTNGETKTNGASPKASDAVPIAIVGMGCRLPGDVKGAEEFWEFLARARSGWSPIPESRFNHAAFHHPNPDKEGCYNPEGGHFIDEDVGLFDAPFFNITEKEAISMDPQQRLLLECTYEALENAGIPKEKLVKKSVGVYVGGSFADYELRNCRDLGKSIHALCICIVTICAWNVVLTIRRYRTDVSSHWLCPITAGQQDIILLRLCGTKFYR